MGSGKKYSAITTLARVVAVYDCDVFVVCLLCWWLVGVRV